MQRFKKIEININLRAAFLTAIISGSSGLTALSFGAPGGATLTALAKAWHADHSIWASQAPFS